MFVFFKQTHKYKNNSSNEILDARNRWTSSNQPPTERKRQISKGSEIGGARHRREGWWRPCARAGAMGGSPGQERLAKSWLGSSVSPTKHSASVNRAETVVLGQTAAAGGAQPRPRRAELRLLRLGQARLSPLPVARLRTPNNSDLNARWGRNGGVPNSPKWPTQVPHSRPGDRQALLRHPDKQGLLSSG